MENYIINNKTVAILKKNTKTIIYDIDKIRVINKKINKILEINCNLYGNDINGVKKYAKTILNIKYKVPIILNKEIILLQLNNLRNNYCLFINFNMIIDYKYELDKLNIYCFNNNFNIKISKNSFEKILLNAMKLNNIIKSPKNENFV